MATALPLIVAALSSSGFTGLRAVRSPLPWRDADRVVALAFDAPLRIQWQTVPSLSAWRKAVRLEDLAAFQFAEGKLGDRRVRIARVEPGFFTLLGVKPVMGRLPEPADTAAVVLSYAAWKRIAPASTVSLDGREARVAAVMPPEFWFFHRDVALWRMLPALSPSERYGAAGRLKPFATARDAERELSAISWDLPGRPGTWVQVLPLAERLRSAGRTCGGLAWLFFSGACLLSLLGFHRSPGLALLVVANAALLVAGAALTAIELPAAVYGAGTAGRGLLAEIWFPILAGCAIWWAWRDARRRCRTCLNRLTLPVHFGHLGSPLLERTGTELVCERGHGSLYVPAMHWSASEPERWTDLDSSWRDLFRGS